MFCWLKQWRISSALDDGRDLPAGLRRHVARCDHCKAFLDGSRYLEGVLRKEARTLDEPLTKVTPTPTWQRWAHAATAAAIIAAAAGMWMWFGSGAFKTPAPSPRSPHVAAQKNLLEELDAPFLMPADLANQSLAMIQEASFESMRRELNGFSGEAVATASTLVSYFPRMPHPAIRPPAKTSGINDG